jgi:hypothetical protein
LLRKDAHIAFKLQIMMIRYRIEGRGGIGRKRRRGEGVLAENAEGERGRGGEGEKKKKDEILTASKSEASG